jgi:hypothetical protein
MQQRGMSSSAQLSTPGNTTIHAAAWNEISSAQLSTPGNTTIRAEAWNEISSAEHAWEHHYPGSSVE